MDSDQSEAELLWQEHFSPEARLRQADKILAHATKTAAPDWKFDTRWDLPDGSCLIFSAGAQAVSLGISGSSPECRCWRILEGNHPDTFGHEPECPDVAKLLAAHEAAKERGAA